MCLQLKLTFGKEGMKLHINFYTYQSHDSFVNFCICHALPAGCMELGIIKDGV